jgi:hypothetical protein
MIVILINTYNSEYYINKISILFKSLIERLNNSDLEVEYITVCGGCPIDMRVSVENKHIISITENLSDHNVFIGFEKNKQYFSKDKYEKATYIYLHDTCLLSDSFVECMRKLSTFVFKKENSWIFAQSYGLFNIGICDYNFLLQRAEDFKGLSILTKHDSIILEQGQYIEVENKIIYPLLYYSKYTLANMIVNEEDLGNSLQNIDTYSLNGIKEKDNKSRWICYIASLGIYKSIGSINSFHIPIWTSDAHHPKTEEEYNNMKKFGVKFLRSNFVPLIPYTMNSVTQLDIK